MRVEEIMTPNPKTATLETTLEEVASMMRDEDVGAIPVLDEDEVAGIITDRDIVVRCIAEGKEPGDTTVEDILSEDLKTVSPDDDVQDAARVMAEVQVRRLPVVDEDGTLVGMVSIGDIAVKQGGGDAAGDALEDISEGVKQGGGRRGQQRSQGGRGNSGRTEGRQQSRANVRGDSRGSARGRGPQAISSRSSREEDSRQQRVAPERESSSRRGGKGRRSA